MTSSMPEPVSPADTIRRLRQVAEDARADGLWDDLVASIPASGVRFCLAEYMNEVRPESLLAALDVLLAVGERDKATPQFLADVRAVVRDHWSGLPENRPGESVWARLDAVLFDDDGNPREHPDYTADPLNAVPAGESPGERDRRQIEQLTEALEAIARNAEAWHGVPPASGPGAGQARALRVVGEWARAVLADEEDAE